MAETNRTPFDFAEGESELVSGFNIEYGGGNFAFIFMAEYMNILVIRSFTAAIFASGGDNTFKFEFVLISLTILFVLIFVAARAAFPRMRYDQLMILTWKRFLPFSLCLLGVVSAGVACILFRCYGMIC